MYKLHLLIIYNLYKLFNEEYFADKIDCFKPETPNHLLPYTQGVNKWIGLFFVGGNRLADRESTGCTSYVPIVQNGETTDFQATLINEVPSHSHKAKASHHLLSKKRPYYYVLFLSPLHRDYDCVTLLETSSFSIHIGNISNNVSNA